MEKQSYLFLSIKYYSYIYIWLYSYKYEIWYGYLIFFSNCVRLHGHVIQSEDFVLLRPLYYSWAQPWSLTKSGIWIAEFWTLNDSSDQSKTFTFILTFISHKTSDMTNKKKNKICNWQELSMSNWFIIHKYIYKYN